MPTQTRPGLYTFTDFVELIQDDQKADLLDGVIYMASPESTSHNDLVSWLDTVVRQFTEERNLGRVMVNKVAFRLSDKTAPEPDLAFVRRSREGLIKHGYVDGPPDLAVEIVSPDSVDRDYESKRLRYEEAGVGEYWILDPDESRATILIHGPNGFVEASLDNHIFDSTVLPGFTLDLRVLWKRPLPATLAFVQDLLAGSVGRGE